MELLTHTYRHISSASEQIIGSLLEALQLLRKYEVCLRFTGLWKCLEILNMLQHHVVLPHSNPLEYLWMQGSWV